MKKAAQEGWHLEVPEETVGTTSIVELISSCSGKGAESKDNFTTIGDRRIFTVKTFAQLCAAARDLNAGAEASSKAKIVLDGSFAAAESTDANSWYRRHRFDCGGQVGDDFQLC